MLTGVVCVGNAAKKKSGFYIKFNKVNNIIQITLYLAFLLSSEFKSMPLLQLLKLLLVLGSEVQFSGTHSTEDSLV